jgi:integrase
VHGALVVGRSRPAQWVKPKMIPIEDYEAVRDALPAGAYRDALIVLAATGWHTTELGRFAKGGKTELLPERRKAEGAGVLLCPRTKGGSALRTVVSAAAFAAAKRLRAEGHVALIYLQKKVNEAAAEVTQLRRAKNPGAREVTVHLGSFRHTVATWAIEEGADPAAVATFLNHASAETTKRFYATLAAPPKVPTVA